MEKAEALRAIELARIAASLPQKPMVEVSEGSVRIRATYEWSDPDGSSWTATLDLRLAPSGSGSVGVYLEDRTVYPAGIVGGDLWIADGSVPVGAITPANLGRWIGPAGSTELADHPAYTGTIDTRYR